MSDRLDLPESAREEVVRILSATAPGVEAWVYGSRIKGTAYETSDLDLVLRAPGLEPVDVSVLASVRSAFSESNIPILVDVFDWALVPESFRQEMIANHIPLR